LLAPVELFLSHATSDAVLVAEVRSRLTAVGVTVYTAEHDVQAGHNVHDKIHQAIRRCDVMVVLLTTAGNGSSYVHQEIGFAKRAGKMIVPVVAAEVAHAGLGMLEGIEYIVVDEADPLTALHTLNMRIDQLAQQKSRDDLVKVALVMVALGILIIALSEWVAAVVTHDAAPLQAIADPSCACHSKGRGSFDDQVRQVDLLEDRSCSNRKRLRMIAVDAEARTSLGHQRLLATSPQAGRSVAAGAPYQR
jgi:hypothetical protein